MHERPPSKCMGSDENGGPTSDTGEERPVPAFEARLYADGVTFDGADAALLSAIDRAGSLNAAAADLGRSYSRAHKRLTALEAAFGSLVDRQRGGTDGGGSALTPRADEVLSRFDRLRAEFSGVAETAVTVLEGRVREREGELGVVGTAAGELRALVPPDATAVQVPVRADAVTLQSPESAPPESRTSARNRFRGTVVDLEHGQRVVTASVDVGAERPLAALVTERSNDLLGLAVEEVVVATVKATTIRAVPRR